ncbi:TniQ family protein [Budviciaceae bacterium BWR-B9]|uniref:TniQ family protein n=1 Tax=Limnobaculum allomyrinae TaxID=2791986 RepID=A0ABS1IPP2_9GAMM|nr:MULTISPECIES: TniQ family protein [Limnobaculum]MBK5143729.1 TniQ family protein [Limnobaculum allomyrinae]MBV7693468.1 TniQ family protein [Limnobaculum sp. M2-1]
MHTQDNEIAKGRMKLCKPLIYPKAYSDESPLGYLNRLAYLNHYLSVNWLIRNNKQSIYPGKITHMLAYDLVTEQPWSSFSLLDNWTKTISALPQQYLLAKHARVCPQCLGENKYYRREWGLKITAICLKHKVWLQDICPHCNTPLNTLFALSGTCNCGAAIKFLPAEPVSKSAYNVQLFIQGLWSSCIEEQLNPLPIDSLKERLSVLKFLVQKQRIILNNNKKSVQLIDMADLKPFVESIGKTFFSGKEGFIHFLEQIHKPDNSTGDLMLFYREFHRYIRSPLFSEYRRLLEDYIKENWKRPITGKNTLFSQAVILEHRWIPFTQASKEYGLSESILRKAASQGLIKAERKFVGLRTFTLLYRTDIENNSLILKDIISFLDVTKLLGVTKSQLKQLVDGQQFNYVISPEQVYQNGSYHAEQKYGCSWQFLRAEVNNYLSNILNKQAKSKNECIPIPNLLKMVGNRIETPLLAVINAIINDELTVVLPNGSKPKIRSLRIPISEFMSWLNRKIPAVSYMTIPEAAKYLKINQEFAYQLVNYGFLSHTTLESSATRWITAEDLEAFNERYLLLSRLSERLGINSRTLARQLAEKGLFSVDYRTEFKLRQKLYEISILNLNIE